MPRGLPWRNVEKIWGGTGMPSTMIDEVLPLQANISQSNARVESSKRLLLISIISSGKVSQSRILEGLSSTRRSTFSALPFSAMRNLFFHGILLLRHLKNYDC